MEKRNYVKPLLNSEAFVPDSYIAACETFKIACLMEDNDNIPRNDPYYSYKIHRSGQCGNINNQAIVTNSEGIISTVQEKNTLQGPDLDISITTPGIVGESLYGKEGTKIEWTTQYNYGGRIGLITWYHQGYLTSEPSTINSNHS